MSRMTRVALALALALVVGTGTALAQPGATPPSSVPSPTPAPPSSSVPGNLPPAPGTAPIAELPPLPAADMTGTVITFADAVRLAMARATDARVAADEVQRADALLAESTAALRPLVGVQGAYTQLESTRHSNTVEVAAAESFLGELTVAMPLLNFRERADRQRARDNLEIAQADLMTARRAVAIEAGKAYLAVFASQRSIVVAQLAEVTAQAHVDYAEHRHTGGLGTELDTVRAQAELATDDAQLAQAQTALVRAEEALGVLTGGNAPLVSKDEPDLDTHPDPAGVGKRADVLAAQRKVDAAVWSRDQQWTEWAPTLSLNGFGFFSAPQINPTPQLGFDVMLTVAVPLYDGGFRGGLKRERLAIEAEARDQQSLTNRQANSDIRLADEEVKQARTSRDASHKAADLASRALDLANIAYKGGTGTSLDVIDAQRSARDAAAQAVIADDDLRQAELDLLAATGAFP